MMKFIFNIARGGGRLQKMDTCSIRYSEKRVACQSFPSKIKYVTEESGNKFAIIGDYKCKMCAQYGKLGGCAAMEVRW